MGDFSYDFKWVGSTKPQSDPSDDDQICGVVRKLAEDRRLEFEVIRVERAYNSWLMTLQARRGSITIRNVQCRVRVPEGVTEQQAYDGLRPFMDRILGAFIDRVLAEIRSGESSLERQERDSIRFEAAGEVTAVERPGRKIFEV